MKKGLHLSFPFRIGSQGRAQAPVSHEEAVLEELKQLILTNPGERLFIPSFGGGVNRLLFEGTNNNTSALAQATLTQAIQKWLAGRLILNNVTVTAQDATIEITIIYQTSVSGTRTKAVFTRSGA